ncbi:hypothetical protein EAH57_09505 [Acinetobacter sp. 2JN-4]|nr:hypothetical protein EAH57_09505 [Acinetobacter sp. 2JN-4]
MIYIIKIKHIFESIASYKLVFSNENNYRFKDKVSIHTWNTDLEIEKLENMVYLLLHGRDHQKIICMLQNRLAIENLAISIEEL